MGKRRESTVDKLNRLIRALHADTHGTPQARALKHEIAEFMQQQARELARLEDYVAELEQQAAVRH